MNREEGTTYPLLECRWWGVVVMLLCAACSPPDGEADASDADESSVDTALPPSAEFAYETSGAADIEADGRGTGRTQRNGRTRLNFTGVADDGENFSVAFSIRFTEGTTGETETIQTPQLTHGSDRYRADALTVRLSEYADGRIAGTVSGGFGERESGGDYESISPELSITGRFDFSY